jgi:hypothetical protein
MPISIMIRDMDVSDVERMCSSREEYCMKPLADSLPDYSQESNSCLIEDAYYESVGDGHAIASQQDAFYKGALAVLRLLGDTWGKSEEDITDLGRRLTHECKHHIELENKHNVNS